MLLVALVMLIVTLAWSPKVLATKRRKVIHGRDTNLLRKVMSWQGDKNHRVMFSNPSAGNFFSG